MITTTKEVVIMMPEKKIKGDLGATKAMMRLVEMGYVVFTPVICESLPFDLIAYKDEIMYRIQCKYNSNGKVSQNTSWSDSHGSHVRRYLDTDFDYYAIYLPTTDTVVFPSVKLKGITIRDSVPNSATPFYWFEDFKEFTDSASKKSYKDFGYRITSIGKGKTRAESHKVVHPTSEELNKLLWEKPTLAIAKDFGVSDKAIEKWAKAYGLTKPPRGYWAKQAAKAAKVTKE